jgi:putative FmdB family regulatory protein
MPIFEYSCRKCNHRFETVVLSTREKIACPKCRSDALEKQLSVFSRRLPAKQSPALPTPAPAHRKPAAAIKIAWVQVDNVAVRDECA